MTEGKCSHNYDQVIWLDQHGDVFGECQNCLDVFKLNVNFDTNTFITTMKPTNHQLKIFNVTKFNDGSYLYERKKVED